MRFLTDAELVDIQNNREEQVLNCFAAYEWDELSISDLALIRSQAQQFVKLADTHIAEKVNFLRAGGDISWAELGKVLGVSKQAAQQKFG